MSDFLPENTEIPVTPSNYLKFEDGENTVRALSDVLIGYEYWTGTDKDRKPVRVKDFDDVPDEFKNNKDNRNNAKYFWAFVVYNFNTKTIQIVEIKQKGIMTSIEALNKSKSWGDPKEYNLVITKTRTGSEPRDVEYSVMPEPKEDLDKLILDQYKNMKINLEALFSGDDLFDQEAKAS
jgi:hypothetical protein